MILRVTDLVKRFGTFTAVDSISFSIQKGQIVGFLGPNGAGKTTTIAMLLGLLSPTSGFIRLFDLDLNTHQVDIMGRVGYSSAYVRAPWRLKVREHLQVFADIYRISNKKRAIDEMIETFSLQKYESAFAGDLSAGNMAKLNLAKAFIHSPELVLLDEPTSSLDPEIAGEVRSFLQRVQQERHTTMLLTSHNMSEIEELSDRVIFINNGKIIAEDTPKNLSLSAKDGSLTLVILSGLRKLQSILVKQSRPYTITGKTINIHVPVAAIPHLLTDITTQSIIYTDIIIERPTLEDYFISLLNSRERRNKEKRKVV